MSFARDSEGQNVLHLAAAHSSSKPLTKLIAAYPRKQLLAGLVAKDANGKTPAAIAAKSRSLANLRLLLKTAPDAAAVRDANNASLADGLRPAELDPHLCLRTRMITWGDNSLSNLGRDGTHNDWLPADIVDMPFEPTEDSNLFADINIAPVIVNVELRHGTSIAIAQGSDSITKSVYVCGSSKTGLGLGTVKMAKKWTQIPLDPAPTDRVIGAAACGTHGIAVSAATCWTWGSNASGQLGIGTQDKVQVSPQRVPDFMDYESRGTANSFGALASETSRTFCETFIGCSCFPGYSVAYTATKIYMWGQNSGQMMNKVAAGPVEDPVLVADATKQWKSRIEKIECTEGAVFVLLISGDVIQLAKNTANRLDIRHRAVDVRCSGKYTVVQTEKKLLRFAGNDVVKVWSPKRPFDRVMSFDVAEHGQVVLSTASGQVYTWESGKITEIKQVYGGQITVVRCDPLFRCFAAVQQFGVLRVSSTADLQRTPPPTHRSWSPYNLTHPGDLTLQIENGDELRVHSVVLYARCPRLLGAESVAPSSSVRFVKIDDGFRVEGVSRHVLAAFIESLYRTGSIEDTPVNQPASSAGQQYRELAKIVSRPLKRGLLEAAEAGDGDVVIELEDGAKAHAHGIVLAARSEYFAARLGPDWAHRPSVDLHHISPTVFNTIKRFAYSWSVSDALVAAPTQLDAAGYLFDVGSAAGELGFPLLSEACWAILCDFISLEYAPAMLQERPPTKLRDTLSRFMLDNLDYYVNDLDALGNALEVVETFAKRDVKSNNTDLEKAIAALQAQESANAKEEAKAELKAAEAKAEAEKLAKSEAEKLAKAKAQTLPESKTSKIEENVWTPARRPNRRPQSPSQPEPAWTPVRTPSRTPNRTPVQSVPTIVQTPQPLQARAATATPPRIATPVNLPPLGTLPSLGSKSKATKPRTQSSDGPRPKLSQKERKRQQRQALEEPAPEPEPIPESPWRQIDRTTPTRPVIELLQRSRRTPTSWTGT